MYRRLDLNRLCGRMAGLHGLQKTNNYITITTLQMKRISSIIPSRTKFIRNISPKELH
jgi:hypothetical protein